MQAKSIFSVGMLLMAVAAVFGQHSMGISDASGSDNAGQAMASRGQTPNHNIPTFSSVEELCQWLCQRQSPHYDYGCPPSCDGGVLDSWSKRAARGRRFDDFSFGFDDYLFMKLLGRNLEDKA